MRLHLLVGLAVLLTSVSAAQPSSTSVEEDPGLVKAGGLAYGLDVAFDNALKTAGLKSPADVAYERASEAAVAQERGNTQAAAAAAQNLRQNARQTDSTDSQRLQQAQSVLENVSAQVPEEAQTGIETALESVERAMDRQPEQRGQGQSGDGVMPDVDAPEVGGGDVESPAGGSGYGR